ncbi:MAG: Lrp/AsnC family transcriptional regulator [Anaerolineae bacterium]|nr:Lrp/AsnC family transcriptional regulator [Anaerolineae bacterium]
MPFDPEKLLDKTGLELLRLLQENARMSFADLGKHVGLTAPAVAERMRRMEEAGIITGYHAHVDAAKLGLEIKAFIRVSDCEPCERIVNLVRELPEVRECHMLTGSDSYILRIEVSSIAHLDALISRLRPFTKSITTSIVLESPVHKIGTDVRAMRRKT